MKTVALLKKVLSFFLILSLFLHSFIPLSFAVQTDGSASNWTLQKAQHLAKRSLIGAHPDVVQTLYQAGGAAQAVNILFPSRQGPDRTLFLQQEQDFTGNGFNPNDTNAMRKLYAFRYYADPYEAKRKLFGLFEDIFSVDRTGDISFIDVENHFKILYEESLGNYKQMVKRVLFDTQAPENSFAMGKYLDLLNQPNKNSPNENYARELLQLFLMLEYKPREDAETPNAQRNYTEEDVAVLARILTGFRAGIDKKVYFDANYHHTGSTLSFLTGALKSGDSFPFYNTASGTIDNNSIINSIGGNNGLGDNTIDYIFSKRYQEIAFFLSWRLLKYYVKNKPSQGEIQFLGQQIIQNNFDIYLSVKWLLSSDIMYSYESMNEVRYKNPLELSIGTLKILHYKNPQVIDPLLQDTNLLTHLDWTPYNPRSIFGREGFDNNSSFMNAYFHNQWTTFASKIAFHSLTGSYNFSELFPQTRISSGIIHFATHTGNTFSGNISLSNITLQLGQNIFPVSTPQTLSDKIEEESFEIFSESEEDNNISPEEDTPEVQMPENQTPETEAMESEVPETSTGEDSTAMIYDRVSSWIFPQAKAQIINANTISFLTGVIVMPDFYILTDSGNKIYMEGSYDLDSKNLVISSGSFLYGTGIYSIASSQFSIDAGSYLERDITIDEFITQAENIFYLGNRLPQNVKDTIKNYLLTTDTGSQRLFLPNNQTYRNKYIKAVLAMMLTQPEFLLLSGVDIAEQSSQSGNTPIQNSQSKLVMIELYGGYDWMHAVIPKNNFEYYQSIRKELAFSGDDLIDLGSVYLNKNLEALKPFYESGELSIVNRVGTPNHSRGHDTASIQVASQKGVQTVGTPGLIGELIKYENNPLNHIALGTGKPPIYTNGKYINIGGNSLKYKNNSGPLNTQEKNHQISTIKNMLQSRTYPGDSGNVFKNSLKLDDVGSAGQESVGHTLSGRLNFTKNLMDNGLGITYYVPGGGGYDTHGEQQKIGPNQYNLNNRIQDLSSDIASFFQKAKLSGQDVTIVVYSEFGRTLKANGTSGTDHGQGGGYFILSTNNSIKQSLGGKVIGKIAPEKEYNDWFGVGIDYRSIWSEILQRLYSIDTTSYFFRNYRLQDDINTDMPVPVLMRNEYRETWSGQVGVNMKFQFDDTNFRFRDGSYIRLKYGQDKDKMTSFSKWQMDNHSYDIKTDSMNISLNLPKGRTYYYELEMVDNQYDTYTASGSFIVPEKFEANSNNTIIPLNKDSFFAKYHNTSVSGNTSIAKLQLFNNPLQEIVLTGSTQTGSTSTGETMTGETNTSIIILTGSVKEVSFTGGIVMIFGTGETYIDTLTHSGIWNGGFVLPQFINKDEFITDKARYNTTISLKNNFHIENIMKVGADTLGVGMKLNQPVQFSLPINSQYNNYKIITSQDGLSWSDVGNVGYNSGKVVFSSDHFSYFAVVRNISIVPPTQPENPVNPNPPGGSNPPPGNNTGGGSSSGGSSGSSAGGGGGGSSVRIDNCPNGDFSSSYYDRTCGIDPKISEKKTQDTSSQSGYKGKEYYIELKANILKQRQQMLSSQTKNISQKMTLKKVTLPGGYVSYQISGYEPSENIQTLIRGIIASKRYSQPQKQKMITRFNEYLYARFQYDMDSTKSRVFKNKLMKQEILLKSILREIK